MPDGMAALCLPNVLMSTSWRSGERHVNLQYRRLRVAALSVLQMRRRCSGSSAAARSQVY